MASSKVTTAARSGGLQRRSIWSRKLDLLYLVFFIVHLPVMFCVDLAPYYPAAYTPVFTVKLRQYYVATYRDRFFIKPPLWFKAYTVVEAFYQVPLTVWAIWGISRDHPMVPLQLLVFAVVIALSTLTCVADMYSWEGYSQEEQSRLAGLYLPYLGLAVLMGVDMFLRLRKTIVRAETASAVKKVN